MTDARASDAYVFLLLLLLYINWQPAFFFSTSASAHVLVIFLVAKTS